MFSSRTFSISDFSHAYSPLSINTCSLSSVSIINAFLLFKVWMISNIASSLNKLHTNDWVPSYYFAFENTNHSLNIQLHGWQRMGHGIYLPVTNSTDTFVHCRGGDEWEW